VLLYYTYVVRGADHAGHNFVIDDGDYRARYNTCILTVFTVRW